MKCLETEKLIGYAYRLIDESAASEVRAHLDECPRCRKIVEQHGRLDAVLNDWKVAEPTPGFDVRVRQALEAQPSESAVWGWLGGQWARGLAMVSLGVLIVAGVVWFTHNPNKLSPSSPVATQRPQQKIGAQTPPATASLHSPGTPAAKRLAHVVPKPQLAGAALNQDKDAQALEDYDLAANFDLLSELPKGEPRVAN